MKLSEARILTELLIEQHLDPHWTFEWHSSKRAIGTCHYNTNEIKLSRFFVPNMSEDEVEQVILHEIAHALTPGSGHNRRWKMVARALGVRDPKSTTKLNIATTDYGFKYAIVIDDENEKDGFKILKGYHRRPAMKIRNSVHTMYLRNRPETKGMLRIVDLTS